MEHVRHELGQSGGAGGGAKSAGGAHKPAGATNRAQTIKLVIGITVLALAAALIAYQTGLFEGTPKPLAASPEAQADDNVNLDNPGQPPPKSGFTRKPQKITP